MPRFGFGRDNRVLRRADFLQTCEAGKVYRCRLGRVFVLPRDDPRSPTRLGLTATRKVGNAVVRNRLKRLAREVFRLALPRLKPGHTVVIVFHRAADGMDFHGFTRQLHSAWRDAGLWLNDAPAGD